MNPDFHETGDKTRSRSFIRNSIARDQLLAKSGESSSSNPGETRKYRGFSDPRHTETWEEISRHSELWHGHRCECFRVVCVFILCACMCYTAFWYWSICMWTLVHTWDTHTHTHTKSLKYGSDSWMWRWMNGIWVRDLPGLMHLGLKTGPSCPMFCY